MFNQEKQIVVVGAGIMGASIACHLAQRKGTEYRTLINQSVGLRSVPVNGYPVVGFIDNLPDVYRPVRFQRSLLL